MGTNSYNNFGYILFLKLLYHISLNCYKNNKTLQREIREIFSGIFEIYLINKLSYSIRKFGDSILYYCIFSMFVLLYYMFF